MCQGQGALWGGAGGAGGTVRRAAPARSLWAPWRLATTKVARDWLANELYEPSRGGKIDAACRDRKVADLITAAGASAPADAVRFSGRFATGEAPRPTTSASKADEGEGVGGDGGTGIEHFDLFEPRGPHPHGGPLGLLHEYMGHDVSDNCLKYEGF